MSETSQYKAKYGPDMWDDIRLAFSTSLMVDTNLTSLAQNLEFDDWPINGNNETPSKYIDFTFEELQELPGLADRPERIDLLVDILKETLSFDDPFGDMVATVDAAAQKEDSLKKHLEKFGISEDFPINLTRLSDDTKAFCEGEDIRTLGEFAETAQNIAQNVVMGGDFKELLSALNASDDKTLARFLPFRPKETGLHLPEAIALILAELSERERYSLLKRYGRKMSEEHASKASLSRDQLNRLEEIILQRIGDQTAFFKAQLGELVESLKSGQTLERYFMTLNKPDIETIATHTMNAYLKQNELISSADSSAAAPSVKKKGFFARLFGR